MSAEVLYAFMHGQPVGVFRQSGAEEAEFSYEDSYSGTPLSLSMPLGNLVDPQVAFSYLDNLLPEDEDARIRLGALVGTAPTTMGLLTRLGEDVAGAVVLSPTSDLPNRDPAPLLLATEDDIAYWVGTLKRDPAAPPPLGIRPRFSLAGQQAKFSLVQVGPHWYWSTAEVPSTHIFKPAFRQHPGVAEAENATLRLADDLGIRASASSILRFRHEDVFVTQRWDRTGTRRIHAEDLMQAVGDPWLDKYGLYADVAFDLMRRHGLERGYLRQVLFNIAVGNADAHAKNTSVLLEGNQVLLSPLYDSLPIFLWPQFDQRLCVSINGKQTIDNVTEGDWARWAVDAGISPELVMEEIRDLFPRVSDLLPDALRAAGIGSEGVDRAGKYVAKLRRSLPGR